MKENKELIEKMQEASLKEENADKGIFEVCAQVATSHFADKWMRVEDGLPNTTQEVNICIWGQFTGTAVYNDETAEFVSDRLENYSSDTVTHWMPLPEPPQE